MIGIVMRFEKTNVVFDSKLALIAEIKTFPKILNWHHETYCINIALVSTMGKHLFSSQLITILPAHRGGPSVWIKFYSWSHQSNYVRSCRASNICAVMLFLILRPGGKVAIFLTNSISSVMVYWFIL